MLLELSNMDTENGGVRLLFIGLNWATRPCIKCHTPVQAVGIVQFCCNRHSGCQVALYGRAIGNTRPCTLIFLLEPSGMPCAPSLDLQARVQWGNGRAHVIYVAFAAYLTRGIFGHLFIHALMS